MIQQKPLVGRSTALVIYHFSDTLTEPGSSAFEQSVVDALPAFARLLAHCRAVGAMPIYMISDREVSIGAHIVGAVSPLTGETVIQHPLPGAFSRTSFEELLHDNGRDTLLVTGNAIDRGLSDTAREARNRGFRPIIVRGASFTHDIDDSPYGPVTKEEIERVHLAALHRHGIEALTVDEVIGALS